MRGPSRDHRARLRRPARSSCRRRRPTDDEVDEAVQAQLTPPWRSSPTSSARSPAATTSRSTSPPPATARTSLGLNTEDWSYEVGQGWVADDFDDQLIGASAGDELTFTTTPKGTEEPADFTVTVGAVQELVAARARPTSGSARTSASSTPSRSGAQSIAERSREPKLNQARQELVGTGHRGAHRRSTRSSRPRPLVQGDLQRRVEGTVRQLQSQGIDVEPVAVGHRPGRRQLRRGHEGRSPSRPSRSTSRCVPSPSPRGSTPTRATSTSSTSAWRCSSSQKPNEVRKAYEQNDARARAGRPDPQVARPSTG